MTNAIGCEAGVQTPDDGCSSAGDQRPSAGVLSAIAAVMRSGASLFVDLIARFAQGIRVLAPLVLGTACTASDVVEIAPAVQAVPPAPAPPEETGPRRVGQFSITFYYVVGEDEVSPRKPLQLAANDNRNGENRNGDARNDDDRNASDSDADDSDAELASISPDLVTIYAGGGGCEPIAEVSKEFAAQLAMQGTGKLHDGRIINVFGACRCSRNPCFKVTQARWGTAGNGRPLQPFRTVAVDPKVVKLGTLLYVPLLDGRAMPGRRPWGGFVHDGCVVADDTGGHIVGKRMDLFVGRKSYFTGLGKSGTGGSHAWAKRAQVFDGASLCERKGRVVRRKSGAI